jgi:aldose 1-epimerase
MPPQIVKLVDPASGASAQVLVSLGFNCFRFQPVIDDRPVDVLWSAPGFESGKLRSTASGIPILFPFAGRLRGASLQYGDRQMPLVVDSKLGFAIHGFVHNRPWRVIAQTAASVTGEFHASRDDAVLAHLWPADFRIRVCYELNARALESRITIDNPSSDPLPWGLGTHGYFRVPLGPEGAKDDCRIWVPARQYWELAGMLPTGRKLPADGPRGVARGMFFGETHFDDILTDLESESGRNTCSIDDLSAGRRLTLDFDPTFRDCVVFNPPHREAICFEPYTTVPDAFALAERGIDTDLRILKPGETFQTQINLRLEPMEHTASSR